LLLTEAIGMKRGVWQPMKEGLITATEKKGGIRYVNGWFPGFGASFNLMKNIHCIVETST
jgi:hypothetical protein